MLVDALACCAAVRSKAELPEILFAGTVASKIIAVAPEAPSVAIAACDILIVADGWQRVEAVVGLVPL